MVPRPDMVVASPELDGRSGSNRAVRRSLLTAETDREAIDAWVSSYDSPNTRETYRREAYRLWLWAVLECRKAFSSLGHEDLLEYRGFLLDPQPAHLWVSEGGQKFPRADPRWRPFYRKLNKAGQQQAMTILNVLFSWLVESRYLEGNPLSLSRRRKKPTEPQVHRHLSPEMWRQTLEYVEELPRGTSREQRHYHRARWLVSLFYLTGARISEVVSTSMGQFYAAQGEDGEIRWWLRIQGKGEKARDVPATSDLMAELAVYRESYGLSPIPHRDEVIPLMMRYGERMLPMTRSSAHVAIKQVFKGAAVRLRAKGPEWKNRADLLEAASAHWFRHTAGSHMASKMNLVTVRDNLGHGNISTTNTYLHTGNDARHQETEQHFKIEWPRPVK
ncbi:hypothetical protein AS149_13655 [Burkholderia cenocepacia]|nr:hypothetical protein AS149_13655 [Burkholderia cenocepacia]